MLRMANSGKMKNPVVVKLGGSFLMADGKANVKDFQEMAVTLRNQALKNNQPMVVVVGGGITLVLY